jgi:hypothetical protein
VRTDIRARREPTFAMRAMHSSQGARQQRFTKFLLLCRGRGAYVDDGIALKEIVMNKQLILAVGLLAAAPLPAAAANFSVDALVNSANISGGTVTGTGLDTISLTAGQNFSVTSSTNDLWSLGSLPRYSDADGLTGDRLAAAADDSGQPVNTLIGADFGLVTANGLTASYGTLVGEISGVFEILGSDFHGPAWATGTLTLFNWDTNTSDNTGAILVDVSTGAAPEPAAWALMLAGFFSMGFMARRFVAAVA